MIWIIISLLVIGLLVYNFSRDRDQMLQRQVDSNGGMAKKYQTLIEHLTQEPGARVAKVTRDHIQVQLLGPNTSTNFFITENFNSVDIEWVLNLGVLGTHKNKWSFKNNYPQENMIAEIEQFMEWKMQQMFGSID